LDFATDKRNATKNPSGYLTDFLRGGQKSRTSF